MIKNTKNQSTLYKKNRKKLTGLIPKSSLLILHSNDEMPRNGDQTFPYRQDSNFYYFTGIDQEKSVFMLHKDQNGATSAYLFIIKSNPLLEIWNGHRLTLDEATEVSGIKQVFTLDDFDFKLRELMLKSDQVFLNQNEYLKFITEVEVRENRFTKTLKQQYPTHEYKRAAPLLTKLRLVKEPEEIDVMQKACDITENSFYRVINTLKPEMNEYEVEAELTYSFLKQDASGHAYAPIVASGKNACVLHYITNDMVCQDGDLLLLDFGAEYKNYAADCSRTIPVNGKYTDRQRACYEAVLRVQKKAIALFVPGNSINIVDVETKKMMEQEMINLGLFSQEDVNQQEKEFECLSKYLMHGVSHFIGLDVHDVGDKDTPFEKGMVLTIEPGLYIPEENIGIRIEDNIMVDDVPVNLMKNIPKEIEDIERLFETVRRENQS